MAKAKTVQKHAHWIFLKPGDIVDVVAPGFSCTAEELSSGVKYLEGLGLKPRVPKNIFGPDVVCANRDETRYEHLRKALSANDSKAVWCARGGYGSIRLLPMIKKMKRPKTCKLLIGYSDITTLHNILNNEWGWPSLHGPLIDRLGSDRPQAEERKAVSDVIFGHKKSVEFSSLEPMNVSAKSARVLRGVLVGGNLKVIEGELGTPWQKNPDGKILFFEEIGERGYRIDRMLTHLELAGYFEKVKAIILGSFVGGDEPDKTSRVWPVIERFAQNAKFPVFKGLPVGHGDLQMPLPLGVEAQYSGRTLTIPTGGIEG